MTAIQPQLPEGLATVAKKNRQKVLTQCETTVLCIPDGNGTREPLTAKAVVAALGVRRAIVLSDEDTKGYWVRPGIEDQKQFQNRLAESGLPGYIWKAVDPEGEDWNRLVKRLVGNRRSNQDPVGSSSTTNLVDLQVEGSSAPSVVGHAEEKSLESGLPETAPRGASSGEGAEGADSGTHSNTGRERQRLRKRARLARDDALEVVPSASNARLVGRRSPPPESGFAKLATELIMEIFKICFEDAAMTKQHYRTLKRLHNIDRRCRKILRDMPALWTKITSAYPKRWIKRALTFSQNRLLHVEAGPDKDTGGLETFNQVLLRIKRHRDRWASLSLQFPSKTLTRVKKYLDGPAPSLEALSLTMADAAVATGLALPMGDALRREVDSPLEILGREGGKLKRLLLNNIPCVWDPSSFTTLTELGLVNGVHLRFDDLLTFLRGSSNLQALRLVNVKFVDGTAQLVETISLPHLIELVLAELIEPVNLGALFLSIDAPECHRLRLDLHPSEGFIAHPVLPLRVASTVQKSPSSGSDSQSFMVFRSNRNTQSASWTSEDKARFGRGEQQPSFNISFRSTSSGLADAFCRLVRGVRVIVGETGKIVVDVDDSLSGAIAEHPGLELEAIVPSLSPTFFEELNVVEIRANVVNRFLGRLGRMMAPGESEPWSFDALEVIRLRAIPKRRRGTMPDAEYRCSLEQFISLIRKRRYGVDRDEAIPESGALMSIALEGRFAIEVETGELLGEGDRLWGIGINHLGGLLVYGGAEGEEDEEEEGEEEEEEEEEEEVEEVEEDGEDDEDEDDEDGNDDDDDAEEEEEEGDEGDEDDEVDENDEAGEVEEVEEDELD
ncbi:hypothetical protein FRC00_001352 [Tulasnella sp. 408]|nr:hypothetical protein FRC00_001352 [Tulasnella sp. 408]